MNTSTIPVYVSETARSHRRGQMLAVQLSIVIAGIVLAYWVDYATVHTLTGEVSLATYRVTEHSTDYPRLCGASQSPFRTSLP